MFRVKAKACCFSSVSVHVNGELGGTRSPSGLAVAQGLGAGSSVPGCPAPPLFMLRESQGGTRSPSGLAVAGFRCGLKRARRSRSTSVHADGELGGTRSPSGLAAAGSRCGLKRARMSRSTSTFVGSINAWKPSGADLVCFPRIGKVVML